MAVVLDASALLAYLREEPGADLVDGLLVNARMASVNWAEVVQKSLSTGVNVDGMLEDVQTLGMRIEPFLPDDGERAGRLWPLTRRQGLSLGDRACLSLGLRLGLTVVTCDRAWAQLPIELEIKLLR